MLVAMVFQKNFKTSVRASNIEQAVSSSYHRQSNGQVEACIIICKTYTKNVLIAGVIIT